MGLDWFWDKQMCAQLNQTILLLKMTKKCYVCDLMDFGFQRKLGEIYLCYFFAKIKLNHCNNDVQ